LHQRRRNIGEQTDHRNIPDPLGREEVGVKRGGKFTRNGGGAWELLKGPGLRVEIQFAKKAYSKNLIRDHSKRGLDKKGHILKKGNIGNVQPALCVMFELEGNNLVCNRRTTPQGRVGKLT